MAQAPGGEVLVYEAPDGGARVEVKLDRDTVWLTQRQMADLFDTSTDNVGLHLKNIFADSELEEAATTEDFSVVQSEGKRRVRRQVKHYNLDAIISVGYRVNSRRGVRFRQWATQTLREHLVRGYTINRQRFEQNARSPGFRQELEGLVTGTSKSHRRAQVSAIMGLRVVLPAAQVLNQFDKAAEPLLARSLECRRESRTLAALRDALIPKLISGELRIADSHRVLRRITAC